MITIAEAFLIGGICFVLGSMFGMALISARIIAKNIRAQRQGESEKAHRTAMGYMDKVNPDFARAPAVAKHEEAVLGLLLIYPEHRKNVFDNGLLSQDDFFTELNKGIFNYVESAYRSGDVFTDLNEVFSPEGNLVECLYGPPLDRENILKKEEE